jgi:hypothetical protein
MEHINPIDPIEYIYNSSCIPNKQEYIFLLKDMNTIKYIFYDIKEAIINAIRLNLSLTRLHILEDGKINEMLIYLP